MIKGNEDIFRRAGKFNRGLIDADREAKGLLPHPREWSIYKEILLREIMNHWCWRRR